jgi:DNA polymerase-3 subunit gamma/tau
VAKNESVTVEEEALHIIAQKADGALRDALSIFDQIVSLCGKNISYKDVIENLNVLDYEYYFKSVDGALKGNVSSVLLTFNEILEKGFDGHNFVSGLNSHLRDLLVSKDESSLHLLEATPSVKQRYLKQTAICPVDFLYKALEIGSNCDISYKNSKNPRLHVELSLIQLCRIMAESSEESEKKKPEDKQLNTIDEIPVPSKSEIIRQSGNQEKTNTAPEEKLSGKHIPVIEKPTRTFSIREVISESEEPAEKISPSLDIKQNEGAKSRANSKVDLNIENIASAWQEFVENLKGEGPRIISMFKSIKPEMENERTIKIHLSNAAQRDIFIQNYKPKLVSFLENRFIISDIEIETAIDLSETNEILYTDEQKYNYLQSKYPVLKDFKKTFNLDIT